MSLTLLVEKLAAAQGADLSPNWRLELGEEDFDTTTSNGLYHSDDGLYALARAAGWKEPTQVRGRPRPNQFPLLMLLPEKGWVIAEQWESLDSVRVNGPTGARVMRIPEGAAFYHLKIPQLRDRGGSQKAIDVFWRALILRKGVFFSAIVATVIVNLIGLATALFSMQVYDRVIPRGGFSTLYVLVVGVLIALALDFLLRTTRSLMIEREAAKIDAEVSEYFFARSQAVRLDARGGGIGTMASQIRGWEQIRGLMSSASIFLVADLPFAIFFIFVIFMIAGPLAYVPLVSFPIAVVLALIFARLIRKDTARAQVSGNRKNGMLVESLDAAETIKANRGNWHMLARWNQLMDEVQMHEDPVKRWSSIATSMFTALQQTTYVLIVAFGAVLVAEGELTAGALIACAIIAGRVNGPLVAQLPNLLVQWGYARSSLGMLDALMALPLDQDPEVEGLRPEKIDPTLTLDKAAFAYPGVRTGVEIEKLKIEAGDRVGIIGGIGSGKSTLLRLMAGLYAPAAGNVQVGGLDMGLIAPDVLRRHVGYLPQDTRLLNGSLRENLLMGLSDPGDEKLMATIEQVGLAPLVANHPHGLELQIQEGGRGLSGGQRTLVNMARLMLAKPSIWLLDEPTSNLDQGTEQKLLKTLHDLFGSDATVILSTHRMKLLQLTQKLIVMQSGRVAMMGPTAQVLEQLKKQSGGGSPDKPKKPVRLAS
ncbi:ATP-binding cassette domain-containing protein [Sphingomicrobium sp. XHP0235]|uniref:ATP-binding cassette domain-containing protein n=1 Tax=Sphingomicrobium aquimarinum TaxID=3133971 RepID=UPI0031FF33F0